MSLRRSPDFSRHAGLLDTALMAKSHVVSIGAGGAAGLIDTLARCGIGRITAIDPDTVSTTNICTQNHALDDVLVPKAEAVKAQLARINPALDCTALCKRYEDLTERELGAVWDADLVLAMTDCFEVQSAINRDAINIGTDLICAICYVGCEAVEITASFADSIAGGHGCHRCHTKQRYDAYAAGFENPAVIPSHALAAEFLNAHLGLLAVSRLHARAGSTLPIAQLARDFARHPFLIARLNPGFWSGPGEPFGDVPENLGMFASKTWALDTPTDWRCPDCGTPGVLPSPAAVSVTPGRPLEPAQPERS